MNSTARPLHRAAIAGGSFTVHLITQGVANQGATGTAKLIKD
jgi:hypothetical protein